jgi:hypothetical protein
MIEEKNYNELYEAEKYGHKMAILAAITFATGGPDTFSTDFGNEENINTLKKLLTKKD